MTQRCFHGGARAALLLHAPPSSPVAALLRAEYTRAVLSTEDVASCAPLWLQRAPAWHQTALTTTILLA